MKPLHTQNRGSVVSKTNWSYAPFATHHRSQTPAYIASVVLAFSLCACTSFQFAGSGDKSAPSHLVGHKGMIEMPAGTFPMGAHQGEPDEFPVHDVEISVFWIDMKEVTNLDYELCVKKKVCRKSPPMGEGNFGESNKPKVGVNWREASRYCKWVGKRLPTEAEWEYAARSPKFSVFPWAGPFDSSKANIRGDKDGYPYSSPVGSFETGESEYGMLDMAGNVAEWTSDWYDSAYYRKSPPKNPKGPSLSTGAKVIRGGSWADNDYGVRATARYAADPRLGKNTVGFRCVLDQTAGR
jgi:formylglycine-generating enzyme required for sulfatase activity